MSCALLDLSFPAHISALALLVPLPSFAATASLPVRCASNSALQGASGASHEPLLKGCAHSDNNPSTSFDSILPDAYFKASDTSNFAFFGRALAASGNQLVVGARGHHAASGNVGAAYLFSRQGSQWQFDAELVSNSFPSSSFGHSVAISGNTVVVGAPEDGCCFMGAAYVFVREDGLWREEAILRSSAIDENDRFGWSVAIFGDTIVVGAKDEDGNGVGGNENDDSLDDAGAAFVFVRAAGQWTQEAYLKASVPDESDHFGSAVAIYGDLIVVGAVSEDSSATGIDGDAADNQANASGAAYAFHRIGSTWSAGAYIKASNTDAADAFGTSLSLSANALAVGARYERSSSTGVNQDESNNNAPQSGAVYLFSFIANQWSQFAYVKASNTQGGDQFGTSVSLSENALVVGAPGEDSSQTDVGQNGTNNDSGGSGAAYLFAREGFACTQQAYLKASNTGLEDQFGESVALSGDIVAVGAPREDSDHKGINGLPDNNLTTDSGAAYSFTLVNPGENYCTATINSSGFAASITASGSTSITANTFTLHSANAAPNQFGLFFYGSGQQEVPFGNGVLCVTKSIFRLLPPLQTDGAGSASRLLDFTEPPASSGPGEIRPGSTWHFQHWFRDVPAGGARFNTSDALSVTFDL